MMNVEREGEEESFISWEEEIYIFIRGSETISVMWGRMYFFALELIIVGSSAVDHDDRHRMKSGGLST